MEKIKKAFWMLIKYPVRLFNGISLRAIVIDSLIDKTAKIEKNTNIRYSRIGRYTYVSAHSSVIYTKVGNFCSIAAGVKIGGGGHDLESVSTSPLFKKGKNIFRKNFGNNAFMPYKNTTIDNDVWIGNCALILQGVHIGNGAVIGAGSVVTKDVPPYAVVAGNPARIIRYRFSDNIIVKLEVSRWWEYSDDELKKIGDSFCSPQVFNERLVEIKE